MACRIIRNENNEVTKVLTEQGKESKLFTSISKSPLIKSSEEGLSIYKNIETKKFKGQEDQVSFVYQNPNGTFTESYREVLKNTPVGAEIKSGFLRGEEFSSLVSQPKSLNKDTESGFINSFIQEGIMAEEKVRVGNEYRFSAEGNSNLKMSINAEVLFSEAQTYLGTAGVKKDLHSFTFEKTKDKVQAYGKNGQPKMVTKQELNSMTIQEIKDNFDFSEDIIAGKIYEENQPLVRDTKIKLEIPSTRTEEEVQLRLLNFLNKLGVTVTSISNYVSNYKIRNGVNPNAQALADISNRVVAFQNGIIEIDQLTEEVAHFIVEALPSTQTENVLRNIDKSEEWLQFSDIYRQIYASEYQGEKLEEAVRREVLGKIVANSLANKFSTESKTEIQVNFIQKAYEFVRDFFQNITNNMKPQYIAELTEYLQDAQNLFLREDLSAESANLEGNEFRLYSVATAATTPETKLLLVARKATAQLNNAIKTLRKSGGKSALTGTDQLELIRLSEQLETNFTVEGIASLVNMTNTAADYVSKAIEDSEKNNRNYVLSNEEVNIYQTLTNQLLPSIGQIGELIKGYKGSDWEILKARIEEVQLDIQKIEAKKNVIGTETVRRVIDQIIERGGYPESSRQYFEAYMDSVDGDINALSATFGTLVNSKDGLIGIFGASIVNMNNKSHQDFQRDLKTLQDVAKKVGYTEKEISDFFHEGFIVSPYDFKAHEEAHNLAYLDAYKSVITSNTLTDEEILEKKRVFELELTPEEAANIKREEANLSLNRGLDEKPKVEKYYREQLQKYEDAGISNATITWLSRHLSDVGSIQQRAKNSKGQTDLTLLSLQDREALKNIQSKRRTVKSYVNESGQLKRGLEYVMEDGIIKKDSENRDMVQPIPGEVLSEEAQITLDINKLDSLNTFSPASSEMSQEFLEGLREIDATQGREAAIEYLRLNSYMSMKSDFWDKLGSGESITDKLNRIKDNDPDLTSEIEDLITDINRYNTEMKAVLKIWVSQGNPTEIRGDISQTSRNTILNHSETLAELYKRGREFTKDITEEEENSSSDVTIGISQSNEAFAQLLLDLEIDIKVSDSIDEKIIKLDKQIEEVVKHTTSQNKDNLRDTKRQIDLYRKGIRKSLPKNIQLAVDKIGFDLHDDQQYVKFMQEYAESKLLPYYKRFAPEGYYTFKESLNSVPDIAQTVLDNFKDTQGLIDITPHYSFQESVANADINPNYDTTSKMGYAQPSSTKFINKAFYDKFGVGTKVVNMRIVPGTSSNQKLADLYNATIDFNESSLDAMGMDNSGYNYYTAPQVRKTNLERFSSTLKGLSGEKLRLAVKDAFNFTQEEQIKGQIIDGEQGKIIPKMYVQKLDDQNDIATDLFYSLVIRSKEGHLRSAREEYYGEVSSIMDKAMLRDYGKAFNTTNVYKQMKSAFDYNIYGIKEEVTLPFKTAIGEYDGVKMIKTFTDFIRLRNLGFSPIIAATGMGTMKVQQTIERVVGQYYQKRTYKMANAEMLKIIPESMKEFGQINTQGKLNVLGQYYQAFNLDEGLANSQYGFVARLLPRTAMGLYSSASYTFFGRNLLNVLHDYRVVGGKMVNFQSFKKTNRAAGMSAKDVTTAWNLLEDNVLYKFIEVKNGQVEYNKALLGAAMGISGEELDAEIDTLNGEVRTQTKNLNIKIDNSLDHTDRVYAQRHFLLNMMMMHKGFLVTSTENRFKGKHINVQTGQLEEGSYTGVYNFLGGVIREWRTNGHNVVKAFRDEYKGDNNPDKNANWEDIELRQTSLKRVGVDLVVGNAIMLLSLMMRGLADDPDKKDIFAVQATNLLLYKISSETYQGQQGIYTNYMDILDAPIVAWDSALSMGRILNIASSDEAQRDKGYTALAKNVPIANTVLKMSDLNKVYESQRYYNEVQDNTFALSPAYNLMFDKE